MNRRRFLGALTISTLLPACARDESAKIFPALLLPALEGTQPFPSGQPLLVNFWATWCGPCRAEMASLERLSLRLAGRVRVAGVTVDEDLNLAREWLRRERVTFANFADPGMRASRAPLAITALPQTFLLAADGRILERASGARQWDADETVAAILGRVQSAGAPSARPAG